MYALNLDIPIPRSAWSGLSVYLIPKPRVLICDGFGTHTTLEALEFCFKHRIVLCQLPSHTSYKLQPCNISVFAPLKSAYRDQVEILERGGVNTIGKQHFTSLYSPAREREHLRLRTSKPASEHVAYFPSIPTECLEVY
jgi:hypothetical protein